MARSFRDTDMEETLLIRWATSVRGELSCFSMLRKYSMVSAVCNDKEKSFSANRSPMSAPSSGYKPRQPPVQYRFPLLSTIPLVGGSSKPIDNQAISCLPNPRLYAISRLLSHPHLGNSQGACERISLPGLCGQIVPRLEMPPITH